MGKMAHEVMGLLNVFWGKNKRWRPSRSRMKEVKFIKILLRNCGLDNLLVLESKTHTEVHRDFVL